MKRNLWFGLGATAAVIGAALWWRTHPSACPYGQRFWVEVPHPFITRSRLLEALAPAAGETILEVGPGTGYYTLSVAERLGDMGALHIFDIQQEMLDHTVRRADTAGFSNLQPLRGDAQSLPYADEMFDAAYLVAVLGEIPDQRAALSELGRVLKAPGRLVVGELFGDPHMVTAGRLRRLGADAGLGFERRVGPPFGYFGVLRRSRVVANHTPT